MGPRSLDRGEASMLWLVVCSPLRFNGAAVVRPRRAGIAIDPFAVGFLASMGPRSLDRGERQAGAGSNPAPKSFNGAAVVRPRRVDSRGVDAPASSSCFNGAAVVRPRRA